MNCIDLTSNDLKCWCTSQNIQNNGKLRKSSNYNELHRFDVWKIKSTQNYKSDLISMNLDWFDLKTIKTFELGRNTTKLIKFQWIASIWHQNNQKCWDTSQNIQNYAKLRKSSNYNELHRFDVRKIKPTQNYKSDIISMNWDRFDLKTIKNVEVRRKTLKITENYKTDQLQWIKLTWGQNDWKRWGTSQNYKSNQITMNCIDLTSKQSKMWRYVAKLQKWSNYNELHRFDVKKIKPTQNYKSDQIIMNCIDLTSKRSKLLSYVAKQQNDQIIVHCIDFTSKRSKTLMYIAKHSKQRKTTKVIKLQWIASIWCQKDQINAKLQKWSYFDEFGLIWRQNDQNVWVRSQHYKINQIPMDCIDLTSKQSKMLRYVAKHSKLRKTTKVIKLQWIASIWCQKDQINAKLQKWSYFDELGLIWRQNDQNVWVRS